MNCKRSVLFCRCAFARVVPDEVKNDVLKHLVDRAEPFDAVGDLCEMSARKDPMLADLAAQGELTVVACYPRAVKWLFSAGGAPLATEGVEILNMRTDDAASICSRLDGKGVPAESPTSGEGAALLHSNPSVPGGD